MAKALQPARGAPASIDITGDRNGGATPRRGGPLSRLFAVSGLCLLVAAGAPTASAASSARSRTAVARTVVDASGVYDVTVTLRSPRRAQVVRLVVDGAGTRRVFVRRRARIRMRMHAALRRGAVAARAVGSRRRPRVRVAARRADPSTIGRSRRLIWSDEFAGRAGSRPARKRWTHDIGDWGRTNGELENNTASAANARHDGRGALAIVARRQTTTAPNGRVLPYTSARINTGGRFSFTYGRIEARIRQPRGHGLWPAFWMLGDNMDRVGWPASGEIDVMEAIGQDPFAAYGSIHGPNQDVTSAYAHVTRVVSQSSLADGFHTYGVIWRPGAITWTLDGAAYATARPADLARRALWRFDHPFNIVLNLAVGGSWPGAPPATTRFPASLLVDWVRVYG